MQDYIESKSGEHVTDCIMLRAKFAKQKDTFLKAALILEA